MNGQGCEQIAVVAREWNAARRLALSLRADRNGLECERDNTNPCWRQYVQTGPFDYGRSDQREWCGTCRQRQAFHDQYRQATKQRGALIRRLQRLAL